MSQLCQLNLQLSLKGTRSLGEDIENETGPVQDHALQLALQITFLGRAQGHAEDDQIHPMLGGGLAQFRDLALTHVVPWVRGTAAGAYLIAHRCARRACKFCQLAVGVFSRADDMDQERSIAAAWTFKQALGAPPRVRAQTGRAQVSSPSSSPAGKRTFRVGTTVEMACLYTI